MNHPIGQTSNKVSVTVDLIHSTAAARISREPRLLELIKEALPLLDISGESVRLSCDMGRPIGYAMVVETRESDVIFYAKLVRDPLYTRFVKNGKPPATQQLSVVLTHSATGEYELQDTWIGPLYPPRPDSEQAQPDSQPYWENHAVIFNDQPLQSNTITKEHPANITSSSLSQES